MAGPLYRANPDGATGAGAMDDLIDANADGNTYYGSAPAGSATSAAVWQVERQSVSGTVTTYAYADGDTNFNNIWDNRTALTYT